MYFEQEGKQNLSHVLSRIRSAFRRREDLRSCKVIIFTAVGEGPALAYNKLKQYNPRIVAVTFQPGFSIKKTDDKDNIIETPIRLADDLKRFFDGVGVTVLTGRLPFEGFDNVGSVSRDLKLIKDVLSLFGGGFSLCVQAVLQACDMGAVTIGEKVVVMSGDCAAVMTASTTAKFLSADSGLSINEILCKPRNLSITRRFPKEAKQVSGELFPHVKEIKLLPPV